jgi:hypothetical protein
MPVDTSGQWSISSHFLLLFQGFFLRINRLKMSIILFLSTMRMTKLCFHFVEVVMEPLYYMDKGIMITLFKVRKEIGYG